jgi:multiple sugar transport system substrate-binding protein
MFTRRTARRTALVAAFAASTAVVLASCAGGSEPQTAATVDPDEEVSISFAFWGNDVRAELYDEAIAEFESQHPNIDVQVLFLAPQDYWEKRQVEAAGKGLPDVLTMDLAYIRQYAENGALLDLEPYLGDIIQTDDIDEQLLGSGVVDGVTTAVPLSTNAWGLFLNTTLLDSIGVEPFAGGSWEDYYEWMAEVSSAGAGNVWGSVDPTTRLVNFENVLRAQDKNLFNDDGTPGFEEADLLDFWGKAAEAREAGAFIPQQRVEEVAPLTAFDSALTVSDTQTDNTAGGYLGNLGEGYEIEIVAPPLDEKGAKDLYLKASQLYSIAANSEHPAAAATLLDFLVNSPESGEIFGTNRGLPASKTALEAAELDPTSQMIVDYEASISDRLGAAPPAPVVGYGTLHEKFRALGEEVNHGLITPEEAVSRFFTEVDVVLAG